MSFAPDFLDEIRARVPLSDVIGKRVRLVRKGREFSGLCPFHNEKTPSFTVNEDKGFFHCFGCGAHGDVIGFVMRTDALAFPEAIERLAGMAGLEMPVRDSQARERAEENKTLHNLLETATVHFEKQLRMPAGKTAFDYVRRRGLDEATITQFRLGYAPDADGGLRAAMKRAGFDDEQMIAAGLLKQPEDERAPYEYFRNRLMFPIGDRAGRVIAFGGRVLGDGQPKYLNSPETELFHKGRVLYGLAQARAAARESGALVVVEGYMDVIALAQAGLRAAVAPLGTALTEDQIAELWRLAPEPVLCFDGDAAGQRAAARAIERALPLLAPGRSLGFVTLPPGEDPDTLVRGRGAAAMDGLLKAAEPLAQALWRLEFQARPADTPERRADLHARLKRRLGQIGDATVREFYRRHFGETIARAFAPPARGGQAGADRSWRPRNEAPWRGRSSRPPMPVFEPPGGRAARAALDQVMGRRPQQVFLATLVNHPDLIEELGENLALFSLPDRDLDKLKAEILHLSASLPGLDGAAIERHFTDKGESDVLRTILGQEVLQHAQFARREASVEVARRGLLHLFARFGRPQLEAQLAEAQRLLALDMTDGNNLRLEALKRSLLELDAKAAALDGEGEGASVA
ncbi:MAG: DNA primase [Alphaproteobacteria bacterium]|nr:DNA primase [Alphaproteobacteria bacterium]